MNLREQLPYLGEEQEDGTLSVCGIQIERPNYKAFVNGSEYKSEVDCISILLGIADVNTITKICKDELLTTYANEIHLSYGIDKNRWDSMSLSLREEIISLRKKAFSLELTGNFKYKVLPENQNGKEFFYLHHILKDLFECMDKGIKNDDLKKIPGQDYQIELDRDFGCLFSEHYFSYKRDQFLKWAKKNGYKIPKELEPSLQSKTTNIRTENQESNSIPIAQEQNESVLFDKYIEKMEKFCRKTKEENSQLPTIPEVEQFIQKELKNNKEKLGKRRQLPDKVFRSMWKNLSKDCKRTIGEKTKKNSI